MYRQSVFITEALLYSSSAFRQNSCIRPIQINPTVTSNGYANWAERARKFLLCPARRDQLKTNNYLIIELEDALKSGSPEKRVATLRRITNLFLNEANQLNEQQVAVFDGVLVKLVDRIESRVLSELSTKLAPILNAPIEVVRQLANHDQISVAGPVLTTSSRLAQSDLVAIAKSKGQDHLLAISGRSLLTEAVTDILVERGNNQVAHKLAENTGARFSERGFDFIVKGAGEDDSLTEKLAIRHDIPINKLQELLARATDLVRSRLLASASPENREKIKKAITNITNEVVRLTAAPRNFQASDDLVQQLNRNGKLTEQVLNNFIDEHKYEEMTSTLALFCSAPVELIARLMRNTRPEGLIIACKSATLSWATTRKILKACFSHHAVSDQELDEALKTYLALSQAGAQRTLRFMLVEAKTAKAI